MIRANLSTRPFYNESAVRLWLLIGAAVVVAFTAFNVLQVLRFSTADSALAIQASRDEARATALRAEAARLRTTVDARQLAVASDRAKLANALIDRRTFSWTGLFNQFESTLPDDVRVTSVRPVLDDTRGIVVTVTVVARAVDDVDRFMQHLEGTGAFVGLNADEEHVDDEGMLNATIEAVYRPAADSGGKRP